MTDKTFRVDGDVYMDLVRRFTETMRRISSFADLVQNARRSADEIGIEFDTPDVPLTLQRFVETFKEGFTHATEELEAVLGFVKDGQVQCDRPSQESLEFVLSEVRSCLEDCNVLSESLATYFARTGSCN